MTLIHTQEKYEKTPSTFHMIRFGQNHMYTPYTVFFAWKSPKIRCINMVLANPTNDPLLNPLAFQMNADLAWVIIGKAQAPSRLVCEAGSHLETVGMCG